MSRTKLSALKVALRPKGVSVAFMLDAEREYLVFTIQGAFGQRVLFTVNPDDIFDKDGNRFEYDL